MSYRSVARLIKRLVKAGHYEDSADGRALQNKVEEDVLLWLAGRLSHTLDDKNKVRILSEALFQKPAPFSGSDRMSQWRALLAFESLNGAIFATPQKLFATINEYLHHHMDQTKLYLSDMIKNVFRQEAFNSLTSFWEERSLQLKFQNWLSYRRFDNMRYLLLYDFDPLEGTKTAHQVL